MLSWRREGRRENVKRALMQEPAAARAPRHYVREESGPCINKVTRTYS